MDALIRKGKSLSPLFEKGDNLPLVEKMSRGRLFSKGRKL
jgi:hypothetical protein